MEKEKHEFIFWIKVHKRELILASISIGSLVIIVLGIKSQDLLYDLWRQIKFSINIRSAYLQNGRLKNTIQIKNNSVDSLPNVQIVNSSNKSSICCNVSEHIRNLHPGWNASANKLEEAQKLGINLQAGQTIVDAYTKGSIAA